MAIKKKSKLVVKIMRVSIPNQQQNSRSVGIHFFLLLSSSLNNLKVYCIPPMISIILINIAIFGVIHCRGLLKIGTSLYMMFSIAGAVQSHIGGNCCDNTLLACIIHINLHKFSWASKLFYGFNNEIASRKSDCQIEKLPGRQSSRASAFSL